MALALRDPDLLVAAGALVDVVPLVSFPFLFPVCHGIPEAGKAVLYAIDKAAALSGREELPDPCRCLLKPLVLLIARRRVSRKHAEKHVCDQCQADPPEDRRGKKDIDKDQDAGKAGEKLTEAVYSVAPLHELRKALAQAIHEWCLQTEEMFCFLLR